MSHFYAWLQIPPSERHYGHMVMVFRNGQNSLEMIPKRTTKITPLPNVAPYYKAAKATDL